MKTRQPAVAGAFYPGSKDEIDKMLHHFFDNVKNLPKTKKINGIIVPHAGWVYSGQVAAYAYELAREYKESSGKKFKKIILLGPNHTVYLDKAAIDDNDYWETPLGKVKIIDKDNLNLESNYFTKSGLAHQKEHVLEVQIPFLQYAFNDFEILPIIVGDIGENGAEEIATEIIKLIESLDDETLLVISTDLSHYQPQENAEKLDTNTIKILENLDFGNAHVMDACGKNPLLVTMHICKKLGVKPTTLKYATSGEVSGDYTGVVGYVSMYF